MDLRIIQLFIYPPGFWACQSTGDEGKHIIRLRFRPSPERAEPAPATFFLAVSKAF
jgi:hypothetical protein